MNGGDGDLNDRALTLTARDGYWCWRVYDIDGQALAEGRDSDRDAAWRMGLQAVGSPGDPRCG
jgi:hypothetical protein